MHKLLFISLLCLMSAVVSAQTIKSQVVENGGTGSYQAEIVSDSSCQGFTIYRPQNLKSVVATEGKLPVILYANGGCANSNIEIRYFLNEIVSHGYLALAIGPYDEQDFFKHWTEIMAFMYPKEKRVILANGEEVLSASQEQIREREERERIRKETSSKNKLKEQDEPKFQYGGTYPKMLLEVLDWLTEQNANPNSDYYHCLNLKGVAAMGQSCGGAQVLAVAHDPRISTCIILNSGIGDMEMQGASKETLASLHTPMFYLIGGPNDVAYPNAQKDFERIKNLPIVMANTPDEHEGTYYEKNGGAYAVAVGKWLDWQLKDKVGQSALFLDQEYAKKMYPDWTIVSKNF